jgi:hypothetical protein
MTYEPPVATERRDVLPEGHVPASKQFRTAVGVVPAEREARLVAIYQLLKDAEKDGILPAPQADKVRGHGYILSMHLRELLHIAIARNPALKAALPAVEN